jgi:hypothetical protein
MTQSQFGSFLKSVEADMVAMSGANSPEMRAMALTLKRAMKKRLAQRAPGLRQSLKRGRVRGTPSSPGQSPFRVSERLYKSIGFEVVGGVMRVGTGNYTGRLLEWGVFSAAGASKAVTKASTNAKRKKQKAHKVRTLTILPRPWARPALRDVGGLMEENFILEAQKRLRQG